MSEYVLDVKLTREAIRALRGMGAIDQADAVWDLLDAYLMEVESLRKYSTEDPPAGPEFFTAEEFTGRLLQKLLPRVRLNAVGRALIYWSEVSDAIGSLTGGGEAPVELCLDEYEWSAGRDPWVCVLGKGHGDKHEAIPAADGGYRRWGVVPGAEEYTLQRHSGRLDAYREILALMERTESDLSAGAPTKEWIKLRVNVEARIRAMGHDI